VAGVSESEIIRLVAAAQTVNFDLRPGSTDNLLSAGVSEEIIKAKVEFERESSKLARRHNKFAAFNRAGDLVYADSTRALGNAVRGFCSSIRQTESSPARN
jgi:hypothetical protein